MCVCVQGNLAPAGAVLKFSGKAPRVFKGPAKVYNSERLGNTRTHLPACLHASPSHYLLDYLLVLTLDTQSESEVGLD